MCICSMSNGYWASHHPFRYSIDFIYWNRNLELVNRINQRKLDFTYKANAFFLCFRTICELACATWFSFLPLHEMQRYSLRFFFSFPRFEVELRMLNISIFKSGDIATFHVTCCNYNCYEIVNECFKTS